MGGMGVIRLVCCFRIFEFANLILTIVSKK